MRQPDLPLDILVCDREKITGTELKSLLKAEPSVKHVHLTVTLADARRALEKGHFNTVFIDPLSLGIQEASEFVFSYRTRRPEIVFVLYTDFNAAKADPFFYQGERKRFNHYYYLDKALYTNERAKELKFTLLVCQIDLRWRISEFNRARFGQLDDDRTLGDQLRQLLNQFAAISEPPVTKNSVFLSFSFKNQKNIDSLTHVLKLQRFRVITGKDANISISQAILQRIRDCEFFLSIMTRGKKLSDKGYQPSPWLLEEKGAALAFRKRIVLMVEEGIEGYGQMQADLQRIHFTWRNFTEACCLAVEQLKVFRGKRMSRLIESAA